MHLLKANLHETALSLTIIKSFPRGYFHHDKEYPLSASMIIALKIACAKQKNRLPFGPIDIKRSMYPLIERGLVGFSYYKLNGGIKTTWKVTKKGMRVLQRLDRKVHCN